MKPFVLYRLPNSNEYFNVTGSSAIRLKSVAEIQDKSCFILSSFRGDDVMVIPFEGVLCGLVSELPANASSISFTERDDVDALKGAYAVAFNRFYSAIESGRYQKIVLSRCQNLDASDVVDYNYMLNLFGRACLKYHNAFIYVAYCGGSDYWFGCSPEVLVETDDDGFRSVALAGTMPVGDGEWSDKNIREQRYVSDFMREVLESLSSKIWQSEPYSAKAGGLKHLKTDFKYTLKQGYSLSEVVGLLHPTPAVSGLPRNESCLFILDNEGYDRSFYSGVVGVWSAPHLYVNLRCAHFHNKTATLYAGGGLVNGSELESEWNETISKMKTIMSII